MRWRDLVVAGTLASAVSAMVTLVPFDWLRSLSLDSLFWMRHAAYGLRHVPSSSPAVVVAIDEETYRRPPFKDLPKVMWTQQIARVMNAVLEGGAQVVAFDLIFSTSVERYVRGFDRELLLALRKASRANKVVLAKVQHQVKPISPFPGYSFAVGHQKNIRAANLFEDGDGVIRRAPLWLSSDDLRAGSRRESGMALELAARALSATPEIAGDGSVTLDGYRVPARTNQGMLINFEGGAGTIPTYSLADLFTCAARGRGDYFRQHFAGKVVLIGAVLDVEDRKLTSKRFITGPEGANLPDRCALPMMKGLYQANARRDVIPGVYIHATAVNNLIRRDALTELLPWANGLITFTLVAAAAFAVLFLPSWAIATALPLTAIAWAGSVTSALQAGVLLPMLVPWLGVVLVSVIVIGYRFGIADKNTRFLRRAFALYLPPSEVERLVDRAAPPALGGETRQLTAFFSDIIGFTTISEGLSPEELVSFLNKYLSEVTDIIGAHGGFVDKYIGDAVVGVFGAPLADPQHGLHAVEAALACQKRLAEISGGFGLPDGVTVGARIGINTGEMLVGNIGSNLRFNYTVMGDAVNLASRIEGANTVYGTSILVTGNTAAECGDGMVLREIDTVRVLGRDAPVELFEPIGPPDGVTAAQRDLLEAFAMAREDYGARRFADAIRRFRALATDDPVSRVLLARAEAFLAVPPPASWQGVTDLKHK